MTTRRIREVLAQAASAGLEVLSYSVTKSLKLRVRNRAGVESTVTAAITPSDGRAAKNILAHMRRVAARDKPVRQHDRNGGTP